MKIAIALVFGLALAASLPTDSTLSKKADNDWIVRHIKLYRTFLRPTQPNRELDQRSLGNSFDLEKQANQFTNQKAVKEFLAAYQAGEFLSRGEVFNYNNPLQLMQAIQLFDLFYFAKDYNTFYQVVSWARDRFNDGQFIYAYRVALLNRPDTQGVNAYRPSEIYPSLYANAQAIESVQTYKQQARKEGVVQSNLTSNLVAYQQTQYSKQHSQRFPFNNENQKSDVQAKYKNQINIFNEEGVLSYYTEDVNLNRFFAYEQLKNPSWFSAQKYQLRQQNQNKGENYLYYLQQALNRYNLERNANGLSNVLPFPLNKNVKPGYNPQLKFANGQAVAARPNNIDINSANNNYLEELISLDRRVSDTVAKGQAESDNGSKIKLDAEKGVEVLGNIVQNNGNSPNNQFYGADGGYYGLLDQCRRVVGSIVNDGYGAPAAIEDDNTAQRDPVFYQCVARVVNYFQNLKNQQKPYNKDQLSFPGVKVQSVTTEKLITYFDQSEIPLFNAVDYVPKEAPQDFSFKAQQYRLNYKPFSYQIQVDSDKETNAVVRVFIGAKYSFEGRLWCLEEARRNFVEIDRFVAKLSAGQNTIQRSSQQSARFAEQVNDFSTQYTKLYDALKGGPAYEYTEGLSEVPATFPQNLLLPKGSKNGQEYILTVAVHSYGGSQDQGNLKQQPNDNRAQGFPFDRFVQSSNFQQAKNIYFQTVKIFNKNANVVYNSEEEN